MIENQDTIHELTARIQERQNEVNCLNDSRDFKDAESVRSVLSHVTSQPALLPPFRDPGGMLRRSVVRSVGTLKVLLALLPSLLSRWLPVRWLRRDALLRLVWLDPRNVLPSCPVSALVVFRCVALWRCPYCDRKSSRVPSYGFCWLGAFFTALEGCDEDILASWYDLGS